MLNYKAALEGPMKGLSRIARGIPHAQLHWTPRSMKIRKFNFVGNPSQSPFKKGRGFRYPPLEKGEPKAGDLIFEGMTLKARKRYFSDLRFPLI
mgnify:CR=1 FL=1